MISIVLNRYIQDNLLLMNNFSNSLIKLAEKVYVTRQAVSRWENGVSHS